MRLIVTVDAEADNQWDHGCPISTENVLYWQPFQALCEQYRFVPTYLITSEIAADRRAVAFLRPLVEAGRAEVGAHLHPWTTPPFQDQPGLRFNDCIHVFPSQIQRGLLEEKLFTLTTQVAEAVGRLPSSFRAGRFGVNLACARSLSRLGYVVDSSVTPLVSWRDHDGLPGAGGGPDFRDHPAKPFLIATGSKAQLLELPVTILLTNPLLRRCPWLLPVYRALQVRLGNRLFRWKCLAPQPLWLRPLPEMTVKRLLVVWREAKRHSLPAAVMMFHSSELMPGASPYRPTAESVRQLLALLEEFFAAVHQDGGEGATLTEAANSILGQPGLERRGL